MGSVYSRSNFNLFVGMEGIGREEDEGRKDVYRRGGKGLVPLVKIHALKYALVVTNRRGDREYASVILLGQFPNNWQAAG